MPNSQYFKEAQSILILLQIEDVEVIPAINEMMSAEGIDGLFIGVEDLTLSDESYGKGNKPIPWDQPVVWKVAELMEKAAKKYGKIWGMPITDKLYYQKILNKNKKRAFFFTVGVNQVGLDTAIKINKG
jgi:2-keto-3-deoxy-L-rhamnonate aldolase RhmA